MWETYTVVKGDMDVFTIYHLTANKSQLSWKPDHIFISEDSISIYDKCFKDIFFTCCT